MKITSLTINKKSSIIEIGQRKLIAIDVKTKSCFVKEKSFIAFPTNLCLVSPNTGTKLFYFFADDLGKQLSKSVSLQLNHFLLNQELIGNLK